MQIGEIEGVDREVFKSWHCTTKAIPILGIKFAIKARADDGDRIGKKSFETPLAVARSDWPSEIALIGTKFRTLDDVWWSMV